MADQLTEAANRLERLLLEAFGARHQAIDDWAVIKFAIRDAHAFRMITADHDERRRRVFVVNVGACEVRADADFVGATSPTHKARLRALGL